jgi:RNA polymerase sigma factor (sigma-70 family)
MRMPLSSDALLEEIESLYRTLFPRFVGVAVSIVGDRELGREAVQDAFAELVRNRRSFRGEGPLEAWVWRAVVNAARRTRRRRLVELRERATPPVRNGDTAPLRDAELAARVAALPERQRLVLFLRYYADLDYRAIAETLGIEIGTVSATLHAALRSLRRTLAEARS